MNRLIRNRVTSAHLVQNNQNHSNPLVLVLKFPPRVSDVFWNQMMDHSPTA